MKTIKKTIYVGSLFEYPQRIEEFFRYDFKDRNENVTIDMIGFADTHKDGEYLIFARVSYLEIYKDDGIYNTIEEQLKKAFNNYKFELRISKQSGWRF